MMRNFYYYNIIITINFLLNKIMILKKRTKQNKKYKKPNNCSRNNDRDNFFLNSRFLLIHWSKIKKIQCVLLENFCVYIKVVVMMTKKCEYKKRWHNRLGRTSSSFFFFFSSFSSIRGICLYLDTSQASNYSPLLQLVCNFSF